MPPSPRRRSPRVSIDAPEGADHATESVELLGQEDEVRRAIAAGPAWDRLVANWTHFIQDVLEGWANEGRSFASEAAKKKAIAALVQGTLEKLRRDPRRWVKEHCDR